MSKKLMLLAAGALAALAFAALPVVASAGEFSVDCETGAGKVCEGTVSGGAASLSNTAGETVSCSEVKGTATATDGTSTGALNLEFIGCKETVTIFRFSCNSAGKGAGIISTGPLVSHIVNIEPSPGNTPGILVTNTTVTFECSGFSKKTVTGNVIGHIENPQCGVFAAEHQAKFETTAHGEQQFKQVTTSGPLFDLLQNDHAGGAYGTSAEKATGIIKWNAGDKVKITC